MLNIIVQKQDGYWQYGLCDNVVLMAVLSCSHQGLGAYKEARGPVFEPPNFNMSSAASSGNEVTRWQEIFKVNDVNAMARAPNPLHKKRRWSCPQDFFPCLLPFSYF